MSLVDIEGFDIFAAQADFNSIMGPIRWNGTGYANVVAPGRVGGQAIAPYNGLITGSLVTPISDALYMGVALSTSSGNWSIQIGNAYFNLTRSTGQITVGSYTSGMGLFPANAYPFMEFGFALGTSNPVVVRYEGAPVWTIPNVNTQSLFGTSINTLSFNTANSADALDDFYLCNGATGPGAFPCNTFLGDMRTATQFPTSNGTVEWVPLTSTNWQEVTGTFHGDTAYVRSSTVGAYDYLNFGPIATALNSVLGLKVVLALRKEDAGARTVAPVCVIGGVAYMGTASVMNTSYTYISSLWPVNPATGLSWTVSGVNGAQFGYAIVT